MWVERPSRLCAATDSAAPRAAVASAMATAAPMMPQDGISAKVSVTASASAAKETRAATRSAPSMLRRSSAGPKELCTAPPHEDGEGAESRPEAPPEEGQHPGRDQQEPGA